jgi:hypothetical protein
MWQHSEFLPRVIAGFSGSSSASQFRLRNLFMPWLFPVATLQTYFAGKVSWIRSKLNLAHRTFKMGGVCAAGFRQSVSGARQALERSGK